MSYVEAAMRNARVHTDERGLMPLGAAREIVRSTDVYEKGEGRMVDGTHVLDADIVWAALLSLEDAAEMVGEATRIQWRFHVRGHDNIAPVERYGAGMLPWIESRIDSRGVLLNTPWCLKPCLLAIDDPAAFEVAARIRAIGNEETDTPPGEPAPLLEAWVNRHFGIALPMLVDEPAHHAILERIASVDPGPVRAIIGDGAADSLGLPVDNLDDASREILESAPARDISLGPAVLLGCIDAVCDEFLFPIWDNMNYFVAAMRVTGFAHPAGDALVFQLLGTHAGDPGIVEELHAFGPPFGAKQWGGLGHGRTICDERDTFDWPDGDSPRHFNVTGVRIHPDGRIDKPDTPARDLHLHARQPNGRRPALAQRPRS